MVNQSKCETKEKLDNGIQRWLEEYGVPPERYYKLDAHFKVLLQNLVSPPKFETSDTELRGLYKQLFPLASRNGTYSINPIDSIKNEDLKIFFPPYLRKNNMKILTKKLTGVVIYE